MKLVMGYLFIIAAHVSFLSEMSVSQMTQPHRVVKKQNAKLPTQTELTNSITSQLKNLKQQHVNNLIKNTFSALTNKKQLTKKIHQIKEAMNSNKKQILGFNKADITGDIKKQLENIKRNSLKRNQILNNIHKL